jgi:hypothetical protein
MRRFSCIAARQLDDGEAEYQDGRPGVGALAAGPLPQSHRGTTQQVHRARKLFARTRRHGQATRTTPKRRPHAAFMTPPLVGWLTSPSHSGSFVAPRPTRHDLCSDARRVETRRKAFIHRWRLSANGDLLTAPTPEFGGVAVIQYGTRLFALTSARKRSRVSMRTLRSS